MGRSAGFGCRQLVLHDDLVAGLELAVGDLGGAAVGNAGLHWNAHQRFATQHVDAAGAARPPPLRCAGCALLGCRPAVAGLTPAAIRVVEAEAQRGVGPEQGVLAVIDHEAHVRRHAW